MTFRATSLAAAATAAVVAVAGAGTAQARLIDLHAGVEAGGMGGWGTTANTPDFFGHSRGGAVGFDLGLKLLVFDLGVDFTQILDGSGAAGTLTQFRLGFVIDIPVGPTNLPNGQSANIVRPSVVGGFAFGTPGPVSPPLDAAQVSDKGVVTWGRLEYEHFFNDFLGVGAKGQFGWHYFLGGTAVNSSQAHSQGYQAAGFATATFHLGI